MRTLATCISLLSACYFLVYGFFAIAIDLKDIVMEGANHLNQQTCLISTAYLPSSGASATHFGGRGISEIIIFSNLIYFLTCNVKLRKHICGVRNGRISHTIPFLFLCPLYEECNSWNPGLETNVACGK